MSQLAITCPHCGFSKNVDRNAIPAAVRSIKCPKCGQSFPLEQPDEEESFRIELDTPPVTPAPAAEAPPIQSAATANGHGESKFCTACGGQMHARAEICPSCGVRTAPPAGTLSKVVLLLITFFLGGVGGHRFYQKKYLLGTLYLLFSWALIPSLVALVEFFIYVFRSEDELRQRYPQTSSAAIVLAVVAPIIAVVFIGILAAIAIPQFAAYRSRAYSAAARSDLMACQAEVMSYYTNNQSYPTDPGQLQCRTSNNIALYYLAFGAEEYQLISFHPQGLTAFLVSNSDMDIEENPREEIAQEIVDRFGADLLEPAFHFIN